VFFTPPSVRRLYERCLVRSLPAKNNSFARLDVFYASGPFGEVGSPDLFKRSGHMQLQLKPSGLLRLVQGIETLPDT